MQSNLPQYKTRNGMVSGGSQNKEIIFPALFISHSCILCRGNILFLFFVHVRSEHTDSLLVRRRTYSGYTPTVSDNFTDIRILLYSSISTAQGSQIFVLICLLAFTWDVGTLFSHEFCNCRAVHKR